MQIDPTAILSPLSVFAGAIVGGAASVITTVYTQRRQNRLQRIALELTKRETVYADFIFNASNLLLNALTHDEITLTADTQRLVGLINRMRLFAPAKVIAGAEAVFRSIVEIELKPGVEIRQLAKEALSKNFDTDPLVAFSSICRADLDNIHRTTK